MKKVEGADYVKSYDPLAVMGSRPHYLLHGGGERQPAVIIAETDRLEPW